MKSTDRDFKYTCVFEGCTAETVFKCVKFNAMCEIQCKTERKNEMNLISFAK